MTYRAQRGRGRERDTKREREMKPPPTTPESRSTRYLNPRPALVPDKADVADAWCPSKPPVPAEEEKVMRSIISSGRLYTKT